MDEPQTRETQLAQVREWIAEVREWIAEGRDRDYKKRDKRRFVKITLGNQSVIMEPVEAEDWLTDADGDTYQVTAIWLTQKQYESLPEFEGF